MTDEIELAPPGTGLPAVELFVARTAFGILRNVLSRNSLTAWLSAETRKVLAIARELSPEQMQRRILVPRLTGLEDSSRNWSAAMVLQHLIIVDTGIGELLDALTQDQDFGREVRIADVKPSPEAGEEQLALLENALKTYTEKLVTIESLHTARRHAHPWFGRLDGHGWHTLAAVHTTIHRRQLEIISKKALTSD